MTLVFPASDDARVRVPLRNVWRNRCGRARHAACTDAPFALELSKKACDRRLRPRSTASPMRRSAVYVVLAVLAFLLAAPRAALAAEPLAIEALPWGVGPNDLSIGRSVTLALPAGHRFLGQPDAGELMAKIGNLHNENLLGVVLSTDPDDRYLVSIRYDEEGFVADDETLDAKAILESFRDGEAAYNEERKNLGFTAIHAEGWQEEPRYHRAQHHVVWGLIVSDETGSSVNFNTRVLGRKGYVSVNLVTDRALLEQYRARGLEILGATSFVPGSRYEDFDSSTDKVAEYGLTGLVLGGAGVGIAKAAKIGIGAKLWKGIVALLVGGKKGIVALFAVVAAFLRKVFGRKEPAAAPTEESDAPEDAGSDSPPA